MSYERDDDMTEHEAPRPKRRWRRHFGRALLAATLIAVGLVAGAIWSERRASHRTAGVSSRGVGSPDATPRMAGPGGGNGAARGTTDEAVEVTLTPEAVERDFDGFRSERDFDGLVGGPPGGRRSHAHSGSR